MGATYLRIVGPFYGFVGLGMMLYFASQGAKSVGWPVLAGTARLFITIVGGWAVLTFWAASLAGLFLVVALTSTAFGILVAASVRSPSWGRWS